jgi:hypothetical protein
MPDEILGTVLSDIRSGVSCRCRHSANKLDSHTRGIDISVCGMVFLQEGGEPMNIGTIGVTIAFIIIVAYVLYGVKKGKIK